MNESVSLTPRGFREDSVIRTEHGWMEIRNIDVGIKVFAHDPATGETCCRAVKSISEADSVMGTNVCIGPQAGGGEWLGVDDRQLLWVTGRGWMCAVDLRAGDGLVLVDGGHATVLGAKRFEVPMDLRRVELDGLHALHVGSYGVLVHD